VTPVAPKAPSPSRGKGISRRLQVLVFVFGVAAFTVIVARTGVHEIAIKVYQARWVLLPIVLLWGVVYLCNTIAWQLLIGAPSIDHGDGQSSGGIVPAIPFWRAYAISVASFGINYVTPLVNLGGEPFRIAAAVPYVGASRAAASVVCFRFVHTAAQIAFWITALPLAYFALPHRPGIAGALTGVGAILVLVLAAMFGLARQETAQRTLTLLGRVPLVRRLARRLERNRPTLERIDAQLASMWGPERTRFLGALAMEYVGRATAVVEYLFIIGAIGVHVSYLTAFVIGALSQFFLNLLFFIPFDAGTKEGGMYLVFQLLGLPASLGVYAAIVTRLRELVWIAVGLGFVWFSRARHD
jgi:uncharacterized protein (TIRG00374 family)